MKGKAILLSVAAGILFLAGSIQVAHSSAPVPLGFVTGRLYWTRFSVCEHPYHPGLFLQYYVADTCGREIFLHGSLQRTMVGSTIWAEGMVRANGSCQILDIGSYSLCVPAGDTD
ncbi:MAG TPA: hypothetical protein PKO09_05645 [Anaerolineae bacterium]|nr:hypothetical protein [Anaerolineae bacterium]